MEKPVIPDILRIPVHVIIFVLFNLNTHILKRILSFAVLLLALLFANSAKAQLLYGDLNKHRDSTYVKDSTLPKGEFGIKLGANTQSISGETWEHNYNTGISGGIWARVHKNKTGVRVEALLSTFRINSAALTDSTGNKYYAIADSVGNKGDFRGTYLDIPLIFEYSILPKLIVHAGIQYSALLSLNKLTNINGSYITLFHQGELAGLLGVEVQLPLNISVGGRYKYGFSNVNNTTANNSGATAFPGSWKTNAFQVYACYKIK